MDLISRKQLYEAVDRYGYYSCQANTILEKHGWIVKYIIVETDLHLLAHQNTADWFKRWYRQDMIDWCTDAMGEDNFVVVRGWSKIGFVFSTEVNMLLFNLRWA